MEKKGREWRGGEGEGEGDGSEGEGREGGGEGKVGDGRRRGGEGRGGGRGGDGTLSGHDVTVMMTSSILCLTGLQPLQLWRYCDVTEAEADKPSSGREGTGQGAG